MDTGALRDFYLRGFHFNYILFCRINAHLTIVYGWLDRLKAERPKIVVLTRMKKVRHKGDFYAWVEEGYEPR